MCIEIVIQKGEDWTLSYVPEAVCLTDPPTTLKGLIKQRRRWFNGTLFSTFSVILSMWRVLQRKGSFCSKLKFLVLYLYILISTGLSFILVGIFYVVFSIFVRAIFDNDVNNNPKKAANILENVYLFFLSLVVILSVSMKIEWAEIGFIVTSLFMGVLSLMMVV